MLIGFFKKGLALRILFLSAILFNLFIAESFAFDYSPEEKEWNPSSLNLKQLAPEELKQEVLVVLKRLKEETEIDQLKIFLELLECEPSLPKNSVERSYIFTQFSKMLTKNGAHKLAAEYAKIALQKYKELDKIETKELKRKNDMIATHYMMAEMYDSSRVYFSKTLALVKNHRKWIIGANNNMGYLLNQMQKDSAWTYLKRAEQLFLEKEDEPKYVLYVSILDNMAEYKRQRKQYQEALAIYRACEKNVYKMSRRRENTFPIDLRLIKVKLGIGEMLLMLEQPERVKAILLEIEPLFANKRLSKISEELLRFTQLGKQCYLMLNQKGKAFVFQERQINLMDSLEVTRKQISKGAADALTSLQISEFQKELVIQKLESRYHKIFFGFSLVLALGALLVSILFYRKKITIHQVKQELTKSELKNKQLEAEKLKKSLNQKQRDLVDFSTYISQNHIWVKQLARDLESIKEEPVAQKGNKVNVLLGDIKGRLYLDDKMKMRYENIDQLNHSFYETLANKFPNLTNSERELCGLIRLNLNTKDIALYRSVSTDSVKTARYRLRKKLGFTANDDLVSFFQSIDNQ